MGILDKLHTIANKRQYILFGLEFDAAESDRVIAQTAFNDETMLLHEIANYLHAEKQKDKCQSKGCPDYALGQKNGCTIYENISICVDSKKEY